MEAYLTISFLNDFIFCPRSIYFHQLYGRMNTKVYHSNIQTKGLYAHKTIDTQRYSTSKNIFQGIDIYSEKYKLCGKIDTYNQTSEKLVERKKKVNVIYDGFIYQLYAQYFCLVEMGYHVKNLALYSMDDNKSYAIALPHEDPIKFKGFETLINEINEYQLTQHFSANPKKCQNCIYNNLCDVSQC